MTTTSEVTCSRCGSVATGLNRAPFPGDLGEVILRSCCSPCWTEWLRMQVMLINEHRLSPSDPEHYERLVGEMKTFLKLA